MFKEIDSADQVILADPVLETIRNRSVCPRSTPSMKPDMPIPRGHVKIDHEHQFPHGLGPLHPIPRPSPFYAPIT